MTRRLSDVVPAVSAGLASWTAPAPSRRAQRDLATRLADVQADGLVAASKMAAGAYVADLGMHCVELISEREARAVPGTLAEHRQQLLANSFTGLALGVMEGLEMKWRYGS